MQLHPLRQALHSETHARQPIAARFPLLVSVLIIPLSPLEEASLYDALIALVKYLDGTIFPRSDATQFTLQARTVSLTYSRHTEYVRFIFSVSAKKPYFHTTAFDFLPPQWLSRLPGSLLSAMHFLLLGGEDTTLTVKEISDQLFLGHQLIGSEISKGAGLAFTDLQLHHDIHIPDGVSRFVLIDRAMGSEQSGRMLQRMIEMEAYRLLALLSLPIAKQQMPIIDSLGDRLCALIARIDQPQEHDTELLNALSILSLEAEQMLSDSEYRNVASLAYFDVVQRRVQELRELRLVGVQPFGEFIERRLVPAMHTCRSLTERQDRLMRRLQRASTLLRTRVEVVHEQQNQSLLASMDRRVALQFRLQETVEGLSVVVLTYYMVGLCAYALKALKQIGVAWINPELATGCLIIPVALLIMQGKKQLLKRVLPKEKEIA
jgi:uncharacterized membrane-anchored protein